MTTLVVSPGCARGRCASDAVAGLVLGVQSVPDGLATGLLAGVSPLSGLYGYLVGTIAGAVVTSSAFMVVQGTGAMAMVIADVPAVHGGANAGRALFTLAILTGVAMLAAGLFRLGTILRFVSNAVMVGFINAVGVNIVLGQLSNLTGYSAEGANRVVRAVEHGAVAPGAPLAERLRRARDGRPHRSPRAHATRRARTRRRGDRDVGDRAAARLVTASPR